MAGQVEPAVAATVMVDDEPIDLTSTAARLLAESLALVQANRRGLTVVNR